MNRYGLLEENQNKLDYVMALTVENFFERRLQTLVFKTGMATLQRQLRRMNIPACVICQMEYKRGDRRITLPCKHIYHAGCGTRWLCINKACPICYTEVFGDASKH